MKENCLEHCFKEEFASKSSASELLRVTATFDFNAIHVHNALLQLFTVEYFYYSVELIIIFIGRPKIILYLLD